MDTGFLSTVIWVMAVWTVTGTATALLLAAMIRRADTLEQGQGQMVLSTAGGIAAPRD